LSSRTRRAGIIAWFGALAPDERIDHEPAEQAARRVSSRAPQQPLLHRLILAALAFMVLAVLSFFTAFQRMSYARSRLQGPA